MDIQEQTEKAAKFTDNLLKYILKANEDTLNENAKGCWVKNISIQYGCKDTELTVVFGCNMTSNQIAEFTCVSRLR